MDACSPSKFLFLLLLTSIFILCSAGAFLSPVKDIHQQQFQREVPKIIRHDFVNFPTTTPVTTPPTVVTIPSATPVTITPTPPSTPVAVTPTPPTTNPVTTPTTNNPGVTNPVTTPVVAPPVTTNAPAVPGQSWCVAKSGVPEKSLQSALDYACGVGKADCAAIQQGASCYNPNTLQNHASYAFNSYYQRNPVPTSCDFGGAAVVTSANPSSGSCIFTASSSSSLPTTPSPITTTPTTPATPSPVTTTPTTPATPSPVTTTPTTPTTPATPSPITTTPTTPIPIPTTASSTGAAPTGSSGVPPTILNASNPALGGATAGIGDSPPTVNMTSSVSLSSSLQPFIASIIVVTSIVIRGLVFDI